MLPPDQRTQSARENTSVLKLAETRDQTRSYSAGEQSRLANPVTEKRAMFDDHFQEALVSLPPAKPITKPSSFNSLLDAAATKQQNKLVDETLETEATAVEDSQQDSNNTLSVTVARSDPKQGTSTIVGFKSVNLINQG